MTSERTQDWVDEIVRRLIRRAARRAPDTLSERLQEEWLADLAEQHGRFARLRFGIGCCWAMNAIVREHGVAVVQATSSPAGQEYFADVAPDDFPYFSTRTTTFLLIVCLHAALLYTLAIGLGPKFIKTAPRAFITHVIEAPPRSDSPPPPRPQLTTTKIELPPQETMPPIESDQTDVIPGTAPEPPHPVLPPPAPTVVSRILGGPGIGFPSTNDFYPDPAIHRGEEGAATLRTCVDVKGRLASEPTIIQSTGNVRLDDAALRLAKAGSGHYRATTENGQPVDSCYAFRIRFQLQN
ncbi:MAG TPA: energy transducer TonB [Steroidobacteraceae bacterium]